VSKGKGLINKYRFNREKIKIVPKDKSLTKRYRFSHEKVKGR
jgi:hypothetical protein